MIWDLGTHLVSVNCAGWFSRHGYFWVTRREEMKTESSEEKKIEGKQKENKDILGQGFI